MSDLGPRSFRLGALWALLAASFLMALPALNGKLLDYDDTQLIVGEPGGDDAVAQRDAGSYFTRTYFYAYLPFYGLSYWADAQLGASREHPFLFRFGNVLWHAAAGFAAFAVLARLLRNRVAALLGALVFVVHPLHVESVAWIAGRKELVSGFFFLLAWLCWLVADDGRRGLRVGAVLFFLVACFAKASAVVLPGVLVATALLLPLYAGRRRRAALSTWPLFVAAALPIIVHLRIGVLGGIVVDTAPLGTRVAALVAGWGDTAQRTLVPWDLSIDYPEALDAARLWQPALWLLAIVAAVFLLRRRAPTAAAGAALFLLALVPFNNVFPWTGTVVADRYAYLPLFGLALAVGWAATRAHEWRMGLACVVVVLLGLSAWSATRFHDDEALWSATIRARPDSGLAHVQRGIARVNAGMRERPHPREKFEAGANDLQRALKRKLRRTLAIKAHRALLNAYRHLGNGDAALDSAASVLELLGKPDTPGRRRFYASTLMARALVYEKAGRPVEAARDYWAAAEVSQAYEAWFKAGQQLKIRPPGLPRKFHEVRVAQALVALARAGRIDRTKAEPYALIAELHRQRGERDKRKRALDEASRRNHDAPVVVEAWARFWLDAKSPDFQRAGREVLRLDQSSDAAKRLGAEVSAHRALYHFRRGHLRRAIEAADVARLQGGATPQRLYDLGQIYLEAGRFADAVACYRTAEDALESRSVYRDAIARAYALKAYRHLVADEVEKARQAMQAALAARPALIDAGAAPLRGEIARLADSVTREPELLLLAVAALAGDPEQGERWAKRMSGREMRATDRALLLHLLGLVRGFTPPFRFAEAEEALRGALDLLPRDRWARYRLAQIWVRAGVDWSRVGLQVGSDQRQEQGKAYLKRAVKLLTELVNEDPDFHLARMQRGEAYFALGDQVGAKADYEALRERRARLRESALKEAVLHRFNYVRNDSGDATNLTIALNLLDEALQHDPHYFDALFERGNVYHLLYDRQNDSSENRRRWFGQAILAYRRAMALNPRQTEPRTEWARICLKAARAAAAGGKLKPAHELLNRVAEEVDDVPDLFKERVRLNMRPEFQTQTGLGPARYFPDAKVALDRLDEIAPGDPEVLQLRSLLYRRLGWNHYLQWAKLEAVLKDAGEAGVVRRDRVRRRAVDAWVKALRAWPEDPDNDAIRRRLRELAPEVTVFDETLAKTAFIRGRKAFDRRDFEGAVRAFREALLLFPESIAIRFNYAAALLECRRFDEAKEPLMAVATSAESSDYPEASYELGRLYDRKNEPDIARQWFHRFVAAMKVAGRSDDPRVEAVRERLAALREKRRKTVTDKK